MYPGEKFQGVQLKQSKHLASGFFFFYKITYLQFKQRIAV